MGNINGNQSGRYTVTKHYDSLVSVAFRQWRAHSHCRFLHGYALSISLVFAADKLSEEGWVVGFGDLKSTKDRIKSLMDHRVLVAKDDPESETFLHMEKKGMMQITWLDDVCCEAFASFIHREVSALLRADDLSRGLRCSSVVVREHSSNEVSFHQA